MTDLTPPGWQRRSEQFSRTLPIIPRSSSIAQTNQTLRITAVRPHPSPAATPDSNLGQRTRSPFRAQALAAYEGGDVIREPLLVPPVWSRLAVLLSALALLAGVVGAYFMRIEIVSIGRGILQAAGPPHDLVTQTDGRVESVLVRPGDQVRRGQELFRLESTTTRANLVEASRTLALAAEAVTYFETKKGPLYAERARQLTAQANALLRRTRSGRATVTRMEGRARSFDALGREGLSTALEVADANEAVSAAAREALRNEAEGAAILDQLAALGLAQLSEQARVRDELARAQARQDALQVSLDACVVRAPADGAMGAIPVRVGDTLMNGATLARVLPIGVPRTAVAYVPERDRAFLRNGQSVRVEVDQLPAEEFGAIRGRIVQVGNEIAGIADLRATFGERSPVTEPLYRVDLALDNDDTFRKIAPRLRPESLVDVRFTLREQRVIVVLFAPFKRWLD